MTDVDRVRLATPSGRRMLGPIERERCQKHKRKWVLFRWCWWSRSDITSSEPQIVRGCSICNAEDNAEVD